MLPSHGDNDQRPDERYSGIVEISSRREKKGEHGMGEEPRPPFSISAPLLRARKGGGEIDVPALWVERPIPSAP